jgi:hypothetical protein
MGGVGILPEDDAGGVWTRVEFVGGYPGHGGAVVGTWTRVSVSAVISVLLRVLHWQLCPLQYGTLWLSPATVLLRRGLHGFAPKAGRAILLRSFDSI